MQSISSLVLGTANNLLTKWELIPAYWYQLATYYLENRSCLELTLSMTKTAGEVDPNAIKYPVSKTNL